MFVLIAVVALYHDPLGRRWLEDLALASSINLRLLKEYIPNTVLMNFGNSPTQPSTQNLKIDNFVSS